jgi:hypothetical protein
MAEPSEYEKWLLGVTPGSGKAVSTYDVDALEESPISLGGYRIESFYPERSADEMQMLRAGYRLGDDEYHVRPGVVSQQRPGGLATGRTISAGAYPLSVMLSDLDTPGGKVVSKGVGLGSLNYTQVKPARGKTTGAVGGRMNLDPAELQFEASKGQQTVGYSTPLDLGVLELLAMRDPQALSALLRYKLNF